MEKEKRVILYNSPEAAHKEMRECWIDSHGYNHGCNEDEARYHGSTHSQCEECGRIEKGHFSTCHSCRQKAYNDKYLQFPKKEWNENSPICIYNDNSHWFHNWDDVLDYCFEDEVPISIETLKLVHTEKDNSPRISHEHIEEQGYEDYEIPDTVIKLIDKANEMLEDDYTGFVAIDTAVDVPKLIIEKWEKEMEKFKTEQGGNNG